MREVTVMAVDLVVQMLAAIFSDGEASDSLHPIAQNPVECAAIFAGAAELRGARPIDWRLDRLGGGGAQLGQAMRQQAGNRRICSAGLRGRRVDYLHTGNQHAVK